MNGLRFEIHQEKTRHNGRRYGWLLWYIGICAVGIFFAFYPTLLNGFALMQTAPDDPRLNNYFLEHSFRWVTQSNYIGELWSPRFFYPYQHVLAFSDNLFGSAPIYWGWRLFFSPDVSYQLWLMTLSILNFVSMSIVMRHYRIHHLCSGLGAFWFAFSMPRICQIGHAQLFPQCFMPLAFLFLWRSIAQPTTIRLIVVACLVYWQLLAGIYIGWFFLLSILIVCCIVYVGDSKSRRKLVVYSRGHWIHLIIFTLSYCGILGMTFYPYVTMRRVLTNVRLYHEVEPFLPRISSYFSVAPGSLYENLFQWTEKYISPSAKWEQFLFPGFTLILLMGTSLCILLFWRNILPVERRFLCKVSLSVFVVLSLLSLHLPYSETHIGRVSWKAIWMFIFLLSVMMFWRKKREGFRNRQMLIIAVIFISGAFVAISYLSHSTGISLWQYLYRFVPGGSALVAISRIWTVSYFYVILAVMLVCDALIPYITIRFVRLVLGSIICVVGIGEHLIIGLPSFEKQPFLQEVNEMSALMIQECDVAYVIISPLFPQKKHEYALAWTQISAMWAGLESNVPVLNGYSGNIPPTYPNKDNSQSLTISQMSAWLGKSYAGNLCLIARKPSPLPNLPLKGTTIRRTEHFVCMMAKMSNVIESPN